jgi:WD40 repeat protein
VRVWDAETGKELKTLAGHTGHVNSVNSCVFSPDGKRIASSSKDNTLRVWDAETGKELKTLKGPVSEKWASLDNLKSCVYSPDGKRIASISNGTLRVWDAETGKELNALVLENIWDSCVFSPDGKKIAAESDNNTVRVWDAETGIEQLVLIGHTESVNSCVFSPDGKRIASASNDRSVRVWDAETRIEQQNPQGNKDWMNFYVLSPDGKRTASIVGDRNYSVRVRDAETGKELQELKGHTDFVHSCIFSPDGKRIATTSEDKSVIVWDAETGEEQQKLIGHTSPVNYCAFSPDGKRIATASDDHFIKVWDAETGREQHELKGHKEWVNYCVFSPDGKRIVSASDDKTVKVWDAETGKEQQTLIGHTSQVNSCIFSHDSKRIVSTSNDRTLRVWDADTGKELQKITGHTDWVNSCVFSPDGSRIASTSNDKSVRVWDAETGSLRNIFYANGQLSRLAYSIKGIIYVIDSGGADYVLKIQGTAIGIPIITPVRLYDYSSYDWNSNITAYCKWCGKLLIIEDTMVDAIRSLADKVNNNDLESGTIKDNEDFIIACPHCQKNLRLTPFIVDNANNEQNNIFHPTSYTDPVYMIEWVARVIDEDINAQLLGSRRISRSLLIKDWGQLPEDEKEGFRKQARGIFEKLNRLDMIIKPKSASHMEKITLLPSEIEQMAEMEHERSIAEMVKDGWKYGLTYSEINKTDPHILPWGKISEVTKIVDRVYVERIPELLDKAGLVIVRPEDAGTDDGLPRILVGGSATLKNP